MQCCVSPSSLSLPGPPPSLLPPTPSATLPPLQVSVSLTCTCTCILYTAFLLRCFFLFSVVPPRGHTLSFLPSFTRQQRLFKGVQVRDRVSQGWEASIGFLSVCLGLLSLVCQLSSGPGLLVNTGRVGGLERCGNTILRSTVDDQGYCKCIVEREAAEKNRSRACDITPLGEASWSIAHR